MNKKLQLGQIFTSTELSKFMIGLIYNQIDENSKILDPSIGLNVFLKHLDKIPCSPTLFGVEIDESLINREIRDFYTKDNRELKIGNFFDLPISEKYDFIIENPPYVRQEELKDGNSKEYISNSIDSDIAISAKSNLYIYFLIKSILHLKTNGKLIAVVYDSWLYSSFGIFLKQFLLDNGNIDAIYHIKEGAFSDALIGATVIEFTKTDIQKSINYYEFKSIKTLDIKKYKATIINRDNLLAHKFNHQSVLDFDNGLFISLEELSSQKIYRGVSSLANGYFLFNKKELKEAIPIIKNITKIKKYKVDSEYSLILDLNQSISNETKEYIEKIQYKILNTEGKYRALKEKINSKKDWYKINFKKSGNIIFNYYMRNNIDFILNEKNIYSSDNFYSLQLDKDIYINFAILNSSFSKIAILSNSRNQGNGLKKIQVYEFKKIPIFNIKKIPNKFINNLDSLGKKLSNTNRAEMKKNEIIKEIDKILLEVYNAHLKKSVSIQQLQDNIDKFIKRKI